jgi:N-acyl-D-amino-acid deacylase
MDVDLIIRGGTLVDGTGEPGFPADVAITGDRIVAIGDLSEVNAAAEIDATDRVVAPGFIDVHVHSETQLADPTNTRRNGSLLQGVTTHLLAPDGFGWAPLDRTGAAALWESDLFAHGNEPDLVRDWASAEEYLAIFAGNTPINVVPQVPHCAVRYAVMGWDARPATGDELDRMRGITREWLEAGARALNLGLDYQPSAFADTRELVELSKIAGEYGAIYAAHIRYNDLGREEAWRETMAIGEQAGIPVHISHEHITPETGPLLAEAAARCDLSFESYLYHAGCTHLALTLPIWAQAGGPSGIRERLRNPDQRERMRAALAASFAADPQARKVFVDTPSGRWIGRSLDEVAAELDLSTADFALQVLDEEDPYALMVYHRSTSPEYQADSIRATVQHPAMMVASDGIYHGISGHPRGFGTFARVLRLTVREMGAVSLEQAVRKMSGWPAERFGIRERGLLREGYAADVVVFDPETVADRATWEEPLLEPVGIDRVIVNGQVTVADGVPTGVLAGTVVR